MEWRAFKVAHKEIVEVHDDHVIIREYLTPDPDGPIMIRQNEAGADPEWALVETLMDKRRE
jgi:hypothetical protein